MKSTLNSRLGEVAAHEYGIAITGEAFTYRKVDASHSASSVASKRRGSIGSRACPDNVCLFSSIIERTRTAMNVKTCDVCCAVNVLPKSVVMVEGNRCARYSRPCESNAATHKTGFRFESAECEVRGESPSNRAISSSDGQMFEVDLKWFRSGPSNVLRTIDKFYSSIFNRVAAVPLKQQQRAQTPVLRSTALVANGD